MANMSELTLLNELDKLTYDATGNNSTFIQENEDNLDRYLGNPYGDEMPDRSKVISNDVMDVVEADMPSLARIFLGPSEILKFKPKSGKEDDIKEAQDKTKYVDWQIRHQPWSFTTLSGFIKNAELQKVSVVKYYYEETTEIEEHKKKGMSNEELAVFQQSLEGEDVKSVEIVREENNGDDENMVVLKVERTTKQVMIDDVRLENFRFTKNAKNKNAAAIVGDVSIMTRGELLSQGFDRKDISKIPLVGIDKPDRTRLPEIRDAQEGGTEVTSQPDGWASEEVEIEDLYPLLDYDQDGIAERRHIMRGGDVVLVNEVFNHVPYAMMNSIQMPHKAIGLCRADIAKPTARAKTAILRGVNDNIYAVNNPRIAANKNVNMDDLLVMRPNGIIRTADDSNPGQNMFPVEIPYIGDKALQVIQYWDQSRAQTTGSLMASQGLNADDLGKETATRFEGVQDSSQSKVELVARVMAETGFRELYEGVAWLDSQFQNTEVEVEILGKELKTNPADWKYNHHVVSKVGLGAGDDERLLQTMSSLWVLHQQLQQTQSPMTDEVKRYNILKTMVNASGLPEENEYFNDPEKPEQLLQAENEILNQIVPVLQEQLQSIQNPLAEAETIKAQAKLVEAQGKQQTEIAKAMEQQRQFNIETAQKQDQFMKNLALKITDLELSFNKDINQDGEVGVMPSRFKFNPQNGELESA